MGCRGWQVRPGEAGEHLHERQDGGVDVAARASPTPLKWAVGESVGECRTRSMDCVAGQTQI